MKNHYALAKHITLTLISKTVDIKNNKNALKSKLFCLSCHNFYHNQLNTEAVQHINFSPS